MNCVVLLYMFCILLRADYFVSWSSVLESVVGVTNGILVIILLQVLVSLLFFTLQM